MSKASQTPLSDAVSPLSREVLELYASALAEVRFPDLDLATLHALADEVRDAQDEVDRLDAELRDARDRVAARSTALDAGAERALAYARIYADGNPELRERVQAVRSSGSSDAEPGAPKKRGRPRKAGGGHEGQLEVLDIAAE